MVRRAIRAHMGVGCRRRVLRRAVAMIWLLHWRRRCRRGIRKLATVVSLRYVAVLLLPLAETFVVLICLQMTRVTMMSGTKCSAEQKYRVQ